MSLSSIVLIHPINSIPVRERAVREIWQATLCLPEENPGQDQAGQWQGAQHSTYAMHQPLAS